MVVIHEIFGMTDWVESVTDEFAAAGTCHRSRLLSAWARTATHRDIPANGVGAAIGKLAADQITADLNAVADYVKELPPATEGLRGGFSGAAANRSASPPP